MLSNDCQDTITLFVKPGDGEGAAALEILRHHAKASRDSILADAKREVAKTVVEGLPEGTVLAVAAAPLDPATLERVRLELVAPTGSSLALVKEADRQRIGAAVASTLGVDESRVVAHCESKLLALVQQQAGAACGPVVKWAINWLAAKLSKRLLRMLKRVAGISSTGVRDEMFGWLEDDGAELKLQRELQTFGEWAVREFSEARRTAARAAHALADFEGPAF